ncbi:MAG: hypothetical protein U1C47_03520 [Hydrogenophaga sp.]|jgi:hypothetical protein|nr:MULTISPECIES: hypothetical protein [Hydrogenophaga]MCG2656587.1 hypothetical protein [Hydrogenophaga sp.]MDP2022413.1 hypothetical protein [Hydrogenophaga sp.]MDZ4290974.1 hypothetical protein [Hydrogenophaga sp.]
MADPEPPMGLDCTLPQAGRLPYTDANFRAAKVFVFGKWCEEAVGQPDKVPLDLSGACKYGSLFMQRVFGGAIRGHYEHQYNFIDGQRVDLSHEARDVACMRHPYLHEPAYFQVPELQASLASCLPRAQRWADEFLAQQSAAVAREPIDR